MNGFIGYLSIDIPFLIYQILYIQISNVYICVIAVLNTMSVTLQSVSMCYIQTHRSVSVCAE